MHVLHCNLPHVPLYFPMFSSSILSDHGAAPSQWPSYWDRAHTTSARLALWQCSLLCAALGQRCELRRGAAPVPGYWDRAHTTSGRLALWQRSLLRAALGQRCEWRRGAASVPGLLGQSPHNLWPPGPVAAQPVARSARAAVLRAAARRCFRRWRQCPDSGPAAARRWSPLRMALAKRKHNAAPMASRRLPLARVVNHRRLDEPSIHKR
jgi:hypothetical protein